MIQVQNLVGNVDLRKLGRPSRLGVKVELHWGGTCILGRRDRHRLPRLRARASLFCLTRARVAARRRMVDRSRWVARLVVSMECRYACVLMMGSQLARVLPNGGWLSLLARSAFWAREGGVFMSDVVSFQGRPARRFRTVCWACVMGVGVCLSLGWLGGSVSGKWLWWVGRVLAWW